jgi:ABC-type lipoprotein release transport system permease subunit
MVRRQPGFSAIVIMTLALAIGANTAIYAAVGVILGSIALLASYIPARRATAVDDVALRLDWIA